MRLATVLIIVISGFSNCLVIVNLTAVQPCNTQIPTEELPNYNISQFQELDAIVDIAQFVNFGESSHDLLEMHLVATRMFRYLVEAHGFRVLIFESAWGVGEAMNQFLASDRNEINAEESFFLNAFQSKPVIELLLWIRRFNRLNPDDHIRLGGYQPEQPVTDINAVWNTMAKSDNFSASTFRPLFDRCKAGSSIYKTDLDFIIYIAQLRKNGQPSFTKEQLSACNAGLDETETFLMKHQEELISKTSLTTFVEIQTHLFSFRSYLNILLVPVDTIFLNKNMSQADAFELGRFLYEEGDKARAQIFQTLYETRYKQSKTMFWMHNWHAMKNSPSVSYSDNIPKGTVSLGTRWARTYSTTQYVVIGSIVPCPRCKTPVRGDALEQRFAAVLRQGSAIVNIRHATESYQHSLALNISGSLLVQNDESHLFDVVLSEQFDAIFYISESKMLHEQ
jgi:erythromycin esterase-like protein